MLYYLCENLSAEAATKLNQLQAQVDAEPTHRARYLKASALFKSKTSAAFGEVKELLAKSAPPCESCFYCERDRYRDIEHVRPKRHYPESCFQWSNYVYACTICNQDAKKDTYAVFDVNGNIVKFDRSYPEDQSPPLGDHVLIDLRSEDPLDFLQLDLETGRFVAIGDRHSQDRGRFTRDLFGLNDSTLARIRQHAFQAFRDYLSRYQAASKDDLGRGLAILEEIRQLQHPTVLVEMRRQSQASAELTALFENVPDDIGARPTPNAP